MRLAFATMSDLTDELLRARLPWVSGPIRSWYDDERLASQLAVELAVEADRMDDAEFGAGFRDAVSADIEPDALAWANRRIALSDGGWALAGIRFRGLDRTKPFVDVVATDQLPTPDGLAAVADGVLPVFSAFAPLCLRVDAPAPDDLVAAVVDDSRFKQGAVDQYVVAGQVTALRERPAPSDVSLAPREAGPLAERVAAIYAHHEESARLWASPEDKESLAACAEEGLLFEVLVDGEPAGVVGAIREAGHGMRGFCVQELCLDQTFRGRGLATRAVRRLLEELPAQPGDVLWGTIHPDNLPSLRQARSLGREIVAGFVWVTPHGLPGMP